MEPGPVLARHLSGTWDQGLDALTDDEVVGVLAAARRQSSWAAALELAAVADLDRRRTASALATGDHRWAEHVPDEVGLALVLTHQAAGQLTDLATGTARLPAVATALKAGRIDVARAKVFTQELAGLDHITAAAVAAAVIRDASTRTTTQVRDMLRQEVLHIDPAAARKRRTKAQRDARVEMWAELAGTAALAGRDLPPAEALAADAQLTADATTLRAAGVPGSLQYLRARVYVARLLGKPLHTLLPTPPGGATPDDATPGSTGTTGPDPTTAAAGSAAPDSDSGGPEGGSLLPAGLRGSVNLTVPLATWLGRTDQPGQVAGYGPIDADTARDLADALAGTPGTTWCITLTDPNGRPVAHGCTTKGPGPPPSTRPPETGPPETGPTGTQPSGTGPPGTASRPDRARARLPGTDATAWLAAINVQPIATGDCTHQRQSAGYRPSRSLRHLIQIRDNTCVSPTCRRPATRCDADHTVPYDQGGRTCECNLATPCRHDHKTKQAPGWNLRQTQPGALLWTTPSGRTYPSHPGRYPS